MHDAATMTPEDAIDRYARHGDAEAFATIVRRYQSVAYAAASRKLARREDVEDATQQAFINLARAAGTVRRDVAAWLYRAAQRAAIDLVRRDATRRRHESAIDPIEPGEAPDAAAWRELSEAMDDAIAALPDAERSLVVEHFLAGRPQAELAAAIGVNQATVSRRLAAAVERLRDDLARRGHASLGAAAIAAELPRLGAADVPARLAAELAKVGLAAPAQAAGASLTVKVSVVAAAAATGIAGLAILAMPSGVPSPRAVGATTASRPAVAGAPSPFTALGATYRLADGRDLAHFPPPFPPARLAAVTAGMPSALAARPAPSAGFRQARTGSLDLLFTTSFEQTLPSMFEIVLNLNWHDYDAAAIAAIGWRPGPGDWVLRDALSTQQKLDALARIVGDDTGRRVRFERRIARRPCIVFSGLADRPAARDDRGAGVVALSLQPLDADALARLARLDAPVGTMPENVFFVATRWLDAPFLPANRESEISLERNGFYCLPDARLSRSDPDYRAKLQRVIDNVEDQLGGTWTIEDRDIETWVAVVDAPP